MQRLTQWKERQRDRWRRERMAAFVRLMGVRPGMRILDLGGNIEIWSLSPCPVDVTLLNTTAAQADTRRPWRLPGAGTSWRIVQGDACDLGSFPSAGYDIVFSNSVIEHVGDDDRVRRFAREARRVGRAYWVQTPAHTFPIEAHTGLPFFWRYPAAFRRSLAARLDAKRRDAPWYCPMAGTRHFKLPELERLFPDATLFVERVGGLSKSWTMFKPAAPA